MGGGGYPTGGPRRAPTGPIGFRGVSTGGSAASSKEKVLERANAQLRQLARGAECGTRVTVPAFSKVPVSAPASVATSPTRDKLHMSESVGSIQPLSFEMPPPAGQQPPIRPVQLPLTPSPARLGLAVALPVRRAKPTRHRSPSSLSSTSGSSINSQSPQHLSPARVSPSQTPARLIPVASEKGFSITAPPSFRKSRSQGQDLSLSNAIEEKGLPELDIVSTSFHNFRLARVRPLNHNTSIFSCEAVAAADRLLLQPGEHVFICFRDQSGNVVKRAYTPISNLVGGSMMEFMVKVYPKGVVSQYIHRLALQQTFMVLGPFGQMKYKRGMIGAVFMLAAGTGIAPMWQIIQTICNDPHDDTQINLLYTSRTREDVLLYDQLRDLADEHENFALHCVLSQPSEEDRRSGQFLTGRIDRGLVEKYLPRPPVDELGTMALVCGTPGFDKSMTELLASLGWTGSQIFVF